MAAQIAKHKFERVSGAHSNGVGVHQATGSILIIGKDRFDTMTILFVHRLENLGRYLLG